MIPDIGLMIGAYIVTRMTSFLFRTGDRSESAAVKFFAILTIVVTLFCVSDLITRGVDTRFGGGLLGGRFQSEDEADEGNPRRFPTIAVR